MTNPLHPQFSVLPESFTCTQCHQKHERVFNVASSESLCFDCLVKWIKAGINEDGESTVFGWTFDTVGGDLFRAYIKLGDEITGNWLEQVVESVLTKLKLL